MTEKGAEEQVLAMERLPMKKETVLMGTAHMNYLFYSWTISCMTH